MKAQRNYFISKLFGYNTLASVICNNLGKLYYHVKDLCNQELCVFLPKFSSLCLTDFQPVSCSLSVLYLIEIKGLSSSIFQKFQPLENTVPYKVFLINQNKCILH